MALDVPGLGVQLTAHEDLEARRLDFELGDLLLDRGTRRLWPRALLVGEPRREPVRVSGRRIVAPLMQPTHLRRSLAQATLDVRDALVDLEKLGPAVSCRRQAAKRVGF